MIFADSMSAWTAVAFVSIAASSVYYTWVWRRPHDYKSLVFPQDPCSVRAENCVLHFGFSVNK